MGEAIRACGAMVNLFKKEKEKRKRKKLQKEAEKNSLKDKAEPFFPLEEEFRMQEST